MKRLVEFTRSRSGSVGGRSIFLRGSSQGNRYLLAPAPPGWGRQSQEGAGAGWEAVPKGGAVVEGGGGLLLGCACHLVVNLEQCCYLKWTSIIPSRSVSGLVIHGGLEIRKSNLTHC